MITKKNRWRGAAVMSSATAAALLLTGCLGGGAPQTGSDGDKFSGEVEFWTVQLKECCSDYINGVIDAYEEEHPDVTIKWVDVPNADRSTKLLAAIASGKVPDVVNTGDDTTGLFNDAMADLSKYFSDEEIGTYLPTLLDPLRDSDGVPKGIPWYNGGGNLSFFRDSVVSQAGFDAAEAPATWDEALELARAVHEKTGVYGTSILPYSWVMQSEGVQMLNDDRTEAAFNTPETIEIIEKFKSYYDDGSIAPGAIAADNTTPEQSLYDGKLAFMASDTSTNLRFVEENAPDIYEDIVVDRAMTGPAGTNILVGQQIFQIPEASDNKAGAAEFLKFLTNAENQLALCKLAAILPSTPESLEDPFFTENPGTAPTDIARKVLVDAYPTLEAGTMGSPNDLHLRQVFDEEIRAAMMGSKTPQQAMDDAEKAWNDEIAKALK